VTDLDFAGLALLFAVLGGLAVATLLGIRNAFHPSPQR
jgi:hypothetical protein